MTIAEAATELKDLLKKTKWYKDITISIDQDYIILYVTSFDKMVKDFADDKFSGWPVKIRRYDKLKK